jgi:glyoxylase I family protein
MPRLDGSNHLALTVSDLDRSADWYGRALDMTVVDELAPAESGFRFKMLLQARSFASLALGQANKPLPQRFDECRVGLHRVAFHVPARADLVDFARHLDGLGVAHSGVDTAPHEPGDRLRLRDPDGIWLELFWLDRARFADLLRTSIRAKRRVTVGLTRGSETAA